MYICFADFEFTCGYNIRYMNAEMLSIGLVICDDSYNISDEFYATSKPNIFPKLQKQCRKLTHLTQEEITASPDSEVVLGQAVILLKKYNIKQLYVWGNFDKPGLRSESRQHSRCRKPHNSIDTIQRGICDIQGQMVRKMGLPEAVNIQALASAFGYVPENGCFHNALIDARALYSIHKAVHTTDFRNNPSFVALLEDRLARIAANRRLIEERREKEAFTIPVTADEAKLLETLEGDMRKNFVRLRYLVISAMKRFPDTEDFLYIKREKGILIIPKERYVPEKCADALAVKFFNKAEFPQFVIENYN